MGTGEFPRVIAKAAGAATSSVEPSSKISRPPHSGDGHAPKGGRLIGVEARSAASPRKGARTVTSDARTKAVPIVQHHVPTEDFTTISDGMAWILSDLAEYYRDIDVGGLCATFRTEPRHVSVVTLGQWVDGELRDQELESHLADLREHLDSCPSCRDNVAWARSQRRSESVR
jgi:hypothetical protein